MGPVRETYLLKMLSPHASYLLTELSPSLGAVNCAAPQEPPSILWNPKVQYRVHKSPPLVPILSHIISIHSIPSYLCKIHFNIVHPSTSWLWGPPSLLSNGYRGVKRPGREVDHSPPASAEVKRCGSIHPLPHTP
jgi:hypothetical protein